MLTTLLPRFEQLPSKKLIGAKRTMSFVTNQTAALWGSFMPRKKEIEHRIGGDLYSLQFYPEGFFQPFNPHTSFTKWAATEVSDFLRVPDGMEPLELAGGLYAVFHYKGDGKDAADTFKYIMSEWLPTSNFLLDNRHHFEVLGALYKNNDPNSEEEIWIPVKHKP